MPDKKYTKNVIELKESYICPSWVGRMAHPFMFDRNCFKDAPMYVSVYLYYSPGAGWGYGDSFAAPESAGPQRKSNPHKHSTMDELFFYFGTDPHNPGNLGGEHELWIGEGEGSEKHVFNRNTCVYLPRGLAHGPEICRKVEKPYFQLMIATVTEYTDDIMEYTHKYPPGFSINEVLRELARR